MKEILIGFFIAVCLMLWIAWIDTKILTNKGIKVTKERSYFMNFLIASCWEMVFFIGGFFIGRGFK